MLLALLHPVVLAAALQLGGNVTCPEPALVAADLQKILDISEEYAPKLHASLVREGAWLELTLSDADGTSLGERRLEATEDCAVLSHTVAVVLATWLSDEHPEYLVPLPAAGTVSAAPAPTAAPAENASASGPSPPRLPPPPPPAPRGNSPTTSEVAHARRHRLALSAALGGALASNAALAPALGLGISYDPGVWGLGAELNLAWVGARTQPLAGHQVSWSRWPLWLGPYWRVATRGGRFDFGAGAALGWLRLEGQDFSANIAQSHATVGSYATLRFLPSAGAWQPFLTVTPVLWFGQTNAVATGESVAPQRAALPSFDLLFGAGLRFLP